MDWILFVLYPSLTLPFKREEKERNLTRFHVKGRRETCSGVRLAVRTTRWTTQSGSDRYFDTGRVIV